MTMRAYFLWGILFAWPVALRAQGTHAAGGALARDTTRAEALLEAARTPSHMHLLGYTWSVEKSLAATQAARSAGWKRGLLRAYACCANAYTLANDLAQAQLYADSALRALRYGTSPDSAEVFLGLAWFNSMIGAAGTSRAQATSAERIYGELGNERMACRSRSMLALSYFFEEDWLNVLRNYQIALDKAAPLSDTLVMALAHNKLGMVMGRLGDERSAVGHFEQAELLAERAGLFRVLFVNHYNWAYVVQLNGRWASALDHYRTADSIVAAHPDMFDAAIRNDLGIGIARALVELDSLDQAGELITRLHGTGVLRTSGFKDEFDVARALWLLRTGNTGEAITVARGAFNTRQLLEADVVKRDAATVLERAYIALGDHRHAYEWSERRHAWSDSIEYRAQADAAIRIVLMQEQAQRTLRDSLADEARTHQMELASERRLSTERNRRNMGLLGGLALLILALGLWWRLRATARAKEAIEREKRRSEELLLNILPEEVAEELKAKGEADAVQIDQVTVLFTDFKGFTAMSEQLSPKELVRDIHECFSAFDRIMEKYGIEKIKTIGDAYMAAGGLPTPNTTHALDVVKAALEIRDFIAAGKAHKVAKGLPYFEIRIGIHTGPVVAGIVGVKKFQYDIWGDTVNTASRMESSGEVGQVNISEATYALVKNDPGLTFTPRGKVQAKGKGEMEMYFVEHGR